MRKIFLFSILFLVFLTAGAKSIKVICPQTAAFNPPSKGSIYAFKYTASTYVDIPELNYKLILSGEANSSKALTFYAATWTDHTFLCLYQGDKDMIVTAEEVLNNYVNYCRFSNNTADCLSSEPESCPLNCELNEGQGQSAVGTD